MVSIIVAHTASLETTSTLSQILSFLTYAVIAFLFVLFLHKRAVVVKTENEHTMKLFDLWGVMMFAPAALELVLTLVSLIAGYSLPVISIVLVRIILCAVKSTALSMCVFFTGHYTGSRFLKAVSAVLILLLIALFAFGVSPEGTWKSENNFFAQLAGIASIRITIASLVQILVFIGMGIYCIVKQRGIVHGDE